MGIRGSVESPESQQCSLEKNEDIVILGILLKREVPGGASQSEGEVTGCRVFPIEK